MELSKGLKQTEIGQIPKEWACTSLKEVLANPLQNGLFYEPSRKGKGVPLVNVSDLFTAYPIDTSSLELFEATDDECNRFKVQAGDIFFTRSSLVPTGIAHCNIFLNEKDNKVVFDSHVIKASPNKNVVLPEYLYRFLSSPPARKYFIANSKTATMTTIDQGVINKCPVYVPSKKEQEAIANALSDVDTYIESLEKLIAKKNLIKKGVMQELLTGVRRLEGYKKNWTKKQLKDVCHRFTTGKLDANAMVKDGDYPFFTCAREHFWINSFAFDDEALLVSGNGANVGYIHYYKGKFNAYQRTYVLTNFSANIHFIRLIMDMYLKERIRLEVNAGNTPYITMDTLTEMEIIVPEDSKEQEAIANILLDINKELFLLENRLSKARLLKQGMMQELLTGRIRLV